MVKMPDRIEHTPEDLAIFSKSVRRLARWSLAASQGNPDKAAMARRTVLAMKNMTLDFAEFGPLLPRNGAIGLGVESKEHVE